MEIYEMTINDMERYTDLFISVFNETPWNDSWTQETASVRIRNMMDTKTFVGKALIDQGSIVGMIWGQKEQFYNGIHFQIQEFCVKPNLQGKGYGSMLLEALRNSLASEAITHIYLITSHEEATEGFYLRKGFHTSDYMIVMSRD